MPRKKNEEKAETSKSKTPKTRLKAKAETGSKQVKTPKSKSLPKEVAKTRAKKVSAKTKQTLEALTETKGSLSAKKSGRPARLPRLGQTQLVAFVRDPNCIFTYWEVTPETVEDVRRQLMHEYEGSSMVLRVLKTRADGTSELVEEITVDRGDMNRYVNLEESGGSYVLEIGHKAPSGRYVMVARTLTIHTGPQAESAAGTSPAGAGVWKRPDEIQDYFSDEIIEQSFEPGKKMFSADLAGHGALHRRRLGPQDRHAASRF